MGYGIIIFAVVVALIGLGILAYIQKWFWFQKSSGGRKYVDVYSTTAGKKTGSYEKGACGPEAGTGVKTAAAKSSDCAAACDTAATTCNGYDWNETISTAPVCMLMPSTPTTATYDSKKKDECRALSK